MSSRWIKTKDYEQSNSEFSLLDQEGVLLSLRAFISSRIQRGVAPRPAHVNFGSFLLRYFGATLRPLSLLPLVRPGLRPRFTPLPTSCP